MNANLTNVMRTSVPMDMQGRVFAAQGTLQFGMIPLGYLLDGWLSDYVMEPLMFTGSAPSRLLAPLVGTGRRSRMAALFLFTGCIGAIMSLWELRVSAYAAFEKQ